MTRQLPSLNALRAFEAAARHSNFTKAAAELFVTHAAISRQVRALEEWLGQPLFVRSGRGVQPTEAGSTYQRTLTGLFDELHAATQSLRANHSVELRIRVDPALASQWLVPRLRNFQSLHPEIELVLDPTYDPFDPRGSMAELGIQYGLDPNWPGVDAICLVHINAFPVCSPEYLEGRWPTDATELHQFTLLHEESRSFWAEWFGEVGVPADAIKGPMYDNTHLVLLAAEGGQGIALGDELLAHDALVSGRLIRPLSASTPCGGYYLVRRRGRTESGASTALREWLQQEVTTVQDVFD